jgi:hypothetical protein
MMQKALAGSQATSALLKINGLNLLLPQGDIRSLESASDVDIAAPALQSTGWIAYKLKRWPVYCLSDELSLQTMAPSERRACAMLEMGAGYIGILCDDIIVLKDFDGQRHELPVAMKLPYTPIQHLASYDQGIACATNARLLTAYIEQQVLNS